MEEPDIYDDKISAINPTKMHLFEYLIYRKTSDDHLKKLLFNKEIEIDILLSAEYCEILIKNIVKINNDLLIEIEIIISNFFKTYFNMDMRLLEENHAYYNYEIINNEQIFRYKTNKENFIREKINTELRKMKINNIKYL